MILFAAGGAICAGLIAFFLLRHDEVKLFDRVLLVSGYGSGACIPAWLIVAIASVIGALIGMTIFASG